ncbi:cytochrome b5-like protein [Staphylotrichum tortipilum]|uniref:L-lactate dehydrogenase (cytochrome) n=1 Tax=Staphylotrichum tortipilum TaxID=2831512 RepID=A0AAN6MKC8_9PEZI|nr:cytochrome b5-like protein [Staphylotrichum longicolle]
MVPATPRSLTVGSDSMPVSKHTSPDSCWVVLHGSVYDVTEFLPQHPGGSRIILQLAGRDATAEYDPIHPPGVLEENLKPGARLGVVDPASLKQLQRPAVPGDDDGGKEKTPPPPLDSLLNLDDIEAAATAQISKKCWAYYFSASDDLLSKSLNNAAFRAILLRPRVFVDVTRVSTATTLLGGSHPVSTPLYVSPAAMARLAHPDGEAGIARGISRFGALQLVSHNASMSPEQIVADASPGQIFGWQLYVQNDRAKSEAMLARVVAMKNRYKCIVLTLDAPVPSKREHDERAGMEARLALERASGGGRPDSNSGVGQQLFFGTAADLTWQDTLPWLEKHAGGLPIVIKGIQTHEDAFLAARWARTHPGTIKAIILSNHGGRSLDTSPPAVHTLLEIRKYCPEVFGAVEVWVDGGVKRGTDVVKALCLGARMVGVGRAALGVERTFEILQAEIETCMKMLGARDISELGPRFINTRAVERDIFDGDAGLDRSGLWTATEPTRAAKL